MIKENKHKNVLKMKTKRMIHFYAPEESKSESMSTASDIETIEDDEDEGWEVIDAPKQAPVIEIERKFIVPDNYHERLCNFGFQLQQEFDEVLVDQYFDTHDHDLVQKDHWLRKRNGDWELKYPVNPVSFFREITIIFFRKINGNLELK